MEFDRTAPELGALRLLLRERQWRSLEAAIEAAREAGTGDHGVGGYLRDLHLPEGDHNLLMLAYGLWRGFGPALQIKDLWGMDPGVAAQMLAGLAVAIDRDNPRDLLAAATELLDGSGDGAVDSMDPET